MRWRLELITPGDWEWVIGVNLMGFVHLIQAFLPRLKEQGEGGRIVTTASVAGMICPPGTAPYNGTKFANIAVAETLAAELAGSSIGVTSSALATSKPGYLIVRAIARSVMVRPPKRRQKRMNNSQHSFD
jgi:NAD(P)-dependent dehydrogenase (short-subunit alcohol dehydrogenase family)